MLLLQMFDKLNIELSESVSIYDMNIKTCPLYVGLLGHVPFELLRRELKSIDFIQGQAKYKNDDLYYNINFTLKS